MRRLPLAVAVWLLIALAVPEPAHAGQPCSVGLARSGNTVVATPSPGCGPLNLAVYRYADGAPGVWSPGAFPFERTLPQQLASSSSGTGVLTVELPCGRYQADVWLASGPGVPAAVTAGFLSANSASIMATYRGGLHGERVCATIPPTGPFVQTPTPSGPFVQTPTASGGPFVQTPTASGGPFVQTPIPSGGPFVQTPVPPVDPPPSVTGPATGPNVVGGNRVQPTTPESPLAQLLGAGAGGVGSGQLALAMIVAAVLVAIVFRSPLPSASTQRWVR